MEVLLKEAESSKCLEIGFVLLEWVTDRSEYAKQLGFYLYE